MSDECDQDVHKYIAYLQSFETKYSEQIKLFENATSFGKHGLDASMVAGESPDVREGELHEGLSS